MKTFSCLIILMCIIGWLIEYKEYKELGYRYEYDMTFFRFTLSLLTALLVAFLFFVILKFCP